MDDKKAFLQARSWYVYVNKKGNLVKVEYLVEFFRYDGEKVLWQVVGDHDVEERIYNCEIGIWGLVLIFLKNMSRGLVEKG